MFKLIIGLVIIASVGTIEAKPKPKPIDGRTIGGSDANIEDYPYQLALMDEEDTDYPDLNCGAVLIHPKWALTTGFCTMGLLPSIMSIKYNNSYISKADIIKVSKVIRHPAFSNDDNNIAILELGRSLKCQNCRPIPLSRTTPKVGDNVTLTGWGNVENTAHFDRLKVVTVPVYSFNDCKKYFNDNGMAVDDNYFCIGLKGKGFCFTDFGGPAVINGRLSGLMAFQLGCADGTPSGLTKVSKYVDWIEKETGITID